MKTVVDVQTGDVMTALHGTTLRASGIGSCVVVAALAPRLHVGALAHIMLPGRCPKPDAPERTRYAADAVTEFLARLRHLGAEPADLHICLCGGANVLRREDDDICRANVESVSRLMDEHQLRVIVRDLGGFERRSVTLDVEGGKVWLGVGDKEERIIYELRRSP